MKETTRNALLASFLGLWAVYTVMGAIGLDSAANVLSALLALLASLVLVKAGRVSPTNKMGWYGTAAAAFFWFLADALWASYAFIGLDPGSSGLLPYLYLLTNVFLCLALSGITFTERMRWTGDGRRDLTMGINVSPVQFNDIHFFAKLARQVAETGVNPYDVNVEITERTAMADEGYVTDVLERLSGLGVTSSIDDFGTGYSSLSYLKKYRINCLKIAKPLIDGIAVNEADAEIVQAIVQMAKALKIRTIAEGVEDSSQFDILQSLACDEIQGYYLGRPVPPGEFERLYLSD